MGRAALEQQWQVGGVMKPVYHGKTGHMALYVNENVRQGNPVRAEDCMRLDGTSPQDGETVVCGTCGVELSPYELVTD